MSKIKQEFYSNVETSFSAISTQACLHALQCVATENSIVDHTQGSGFYTDYKGRRHFIVSHDSQARIGSLTTCGCLFIFREPVDITTPREITVDSEFNHPGSFQIVGDYLFLPVENYFWDPFGNSDTNDDEDACELLIYDLSPLGDDKDPVLVNDDNRCKLKGHKAGMVGVTDEWLAIQDNNRLHLYNILEFNGKQMSLQSYGDRWMPSYQGIGLITQSVDEGVTKELYVIGMCTEEIKGENGSTWQDSILLYKLKPGDGKFSTEEKGKLIVKTDPGKGGYSESGVHFRYGAGTYLNPKNQNITCICTGRNIIPLYDYNYNTFSNIDSLEIKSRGKPLKTQSHRSSQNFSLKGFRTKKVKFEFNRNDVSVKVRLDKSGPDDDVYEKVRHGDVLHISEKSPLYISDPSPESDKAIKITIKGVE